MYIMGIDPGLATVGYGVIQKQGNALSLVAYGTVTTPAKVPLPRRLQMIHDDLGELITRYRPDAIAVEELFFCKNVTTALSVGHARGAALIAAAEALGTGRLYEYTPMQVKLSVCGYGHADKRQVQHMVGVLLNMREVPRPDDAADALAVAICHGNASTLTDEYMIR